MKPERYRGVLCIRWLGRSHLFGKYASIGKAPPSLSTNRSPLATTASNRARIICKAKQSDCSESSPQISESLPSIPCRTTGVRQTPWASLRGSAISTDTGMRPPSFRTRINSAFAIAGASVFTGSWCRPNCYYTTGGSCIQNANSTPVWHGHGQPFQGSGSASALCFQSPQHQGEQPGMESLGKLSSITRSPVFQGGYMVVPKAKGGWGGDVPMDYSWRAALRLRLCTRSSGPAEDAESGRASSQ